MYFIKSREHVWLEVVEVIGLSILDRFELYLPTNSHIWCCVVFDQWLEMDKLQRTRGSRRGGCSFVTKLLSKAEGITLASEDVLPESISSEDRETIDVVLTQLAAKKPQLKELDQVIFLPP